MSAVVEVRRRTWDRLVDRQWPLALGFSLTVIALWQAGGLLDLLPVYLLSPWEIAAETWELAAEGELVSASFLSIRRQAIGFIIGAGSGVLVGLWAGVSRWGEDLFDTIVSVTYPLPKIALFPVLVVWLGFSDTARVAVIAMSTFYPSFVNALAGTRSIDERLLWVARNAGAGRLRRFRQVVARAAMPSIVVGVRISLALSFVLTFATESIGAAQGGLGELIEEGFNNRLFGQMYAGILAFSVFGLIADQTWMAISNGLLRGQRTEAVGRG